MGTAKRVAAQALGRQDLARCLLSLPGFFPLPSLWGREDAFVQKGPAAVGEDRLSCARAWGQDIILHGTKSTLMSSRAREEVFHTVI